MKHLSITDTIMLAFLLHAGQLDKLGDVYDTTKQVHGDRAAPWIDRRVSRLEVRLEAN